MAMSVIIRKYQDGQIVQEGLDTSDVLAIRFQFDDGKHVDVRLLKEVSAVDIMTDQSLAVIPQAANHILIGPIKFSQIP